MSFVPVGQDTDLWDDEVQSVSAAGTPVLLVRRAGSVRAYANKCPHLGATLAAGSLANGFLRCPLHGWEFDAATGRCSRPCGEAALRPYDVRVAGGTIFVEIPS